MLQSMRSVAKYIFVFIAIAFVGGFLLYETSGLVGRAQVTPGTAIATVEGEDITYAAWQNAIANLRQNEEARLGRGLTLDEQVRLEDEAYEQLVTDVLVGQELRRRDITVSDEEIVQAALNSPPPQFLQAPELQTDGQFDLEKYRRFLASPAAQQQGIRRGLEDYYRREIPRLKLFDRLTSGIYLSDARLWRIHQDQNDSAQVSYVAFRADSLADSLVTVSDEEVRTHFERNRDEFVRQGRAVVSLVSIPRTISAADTAAARARTTRLRDEILDGADFAEVAQRESSDSVSARDGGSLGRNTLEGFGFVPEFTEAARAVGTGEISQPVPSPFGFHLIRVDERAGDTLSLRHILVPIQQTDSSAVATDRLADLLANGAANAERPAQFDSAARAMGLTPARHAVTQGDGLLVEGRYVPDVAAWAFGGARVGESSDLISGDDGYFLARLDSLAPGGEQRLEDVRDEVTALLARAKKVERLTPPARELAQAAAASSLEAAAQARGHVVSQTPTFARVGGAPGIGVANQAVGAAFGLPVGAVSQAVPTLESVVVLRVDRRVQADSTAWVAQRELQRAQLTQALRQQHLQQFLTSLRREADVEDKRDVVRAARSVDAPL